MIYGSIVVINQSNSHVQSEDSLTAAPLFYWYGGRLRAGLSRCTGRLATLSFWPETAAADSMPSSVDGLRPSRRVLGRPHTVTTLRVPAVSHATRAAGCSNRLMDCVGVQQGHANSKPMSILAVDTRERQIGSRSYPVQLALKAHARRHGCERRAANLKCATCRAPAIVPAASTSSLAARTYKTQSA